jgi:hypothetical protein
MKNVNLEKDIVNAKENSIETFGVILGWFAAIGILGSNERHRIAGIDSFAQDQDNAEDLQPLDIKEHIDEQDDFFQTILVPAINNSYIILDGLSRKSIYKDPITGNDIEIGAMVEKQNLNAFNLQIRSVIVMPKKTLGRCCYSGNATVSDSNYQANVALCLEDLRKEYALLAFSDDDSEQYLIATEEVEGDKRIEALWTKCIVLNKGDESLAKYEYIAKRVELLSTEKAKEMVKLSSAAEFADILKSFDQILRKFTSPILQALVTSIASMTLFSKEDGGSDLENKFLERINEIYSLTEDDLEFALSIMGIEGRVSKSANGNFKYYFLDGNNNENSITSESSRKIYRERSNELSKSLLFVEYEKTLKEEPHWTNSYSTEQLESILDNTAKPFNDLSEEQKEHYRNIEVSKKNDEGYDWWGRAKDFGAGILTIVAAGYVGKAIGGHLGKTTYTTNRDLSHRFAARGGGKLEKKINEERRRAGKK